jgi:alkylhydroperoxidase family enzyme
MHSKDARKAGEEEVRLHVLAGWRDARYLYGEREQAALVPTESVTLVSETHVSDKVWGAAAAVFADADHHDRRLEPDRADHSYGRG